MYKNPLFIVAVLVLLVAIIAGFSIMTKNDGEDDARMTENTNNATDTMIIGDNAINILNHGVSRSVSVGFAQLAQEGYVVVHEDNGGTPGAILGASALLVSGRTDNFEVALSRKTLSGETLYGMLHFDNGDGSFNASDDPPVRDKEGNIVLMIFKAGIDEESMDNNEEPVVMLQESNSSGGDSGDFIASRHAVSMEPSGFSPKTITIKVGDTVTWTNNDTRDHWPASSRHPTHQDLPGFDALGDVVPGASYSFTFTEVGSWVMHDHRKPGDWAMIVVTE